MKKTGKRIGRIAALFLAVLLAAGCGKQPVREEVRIGSLKGPTSMGILFLSDRAQRGESKNPYTFQMAAAADELLPLLVKGELDLAMIPSNAAAVLYQKTQGKVAVIDINTLGVLYLVTGSAQIESMADLKGRNIFMTGKGTTPEAALRYVMEANGISEKEYTLEFKSEPTEVAVALANDPEAVGLLPQPFVTAALMQNESLRAALDLNEEWVRVRGGESAGIVTGVTVVRKAFLEEHPEEVKTFLEEHARSVQDIRQDVDKGASLAVTAGIVAKEGIAKKAIPACNLACITGEEMKAALSEYLEVLAEFEPELVGGALPGEDFYYIGED